MGADKFLHEDRLYYAGKTQITIGEIKSRFTFTSKNCLFLCKYVFLLLPNFIEMVGKPKLEIQIAVGILHDESI